MSYSVYLPVTYSTRCSSPQRTLWEEYRSLGYSKSGFIGFRAFVQHKVPTASVTGTTADGVTIDFFSDEEGYITFLLKYS